MSLLVTATFLIFCVGFGFVSSNAIVFYGTIGSTTSCNTSLTLTWAECVTECNSNTSDCILAFYDSSKKCNLCLYGQVSNVTYTNEPTDLEIALKLSNEVDCKSVMSQLETTGKFDEFKQCEDGWTKYTREKTIWCVTQIRPTRDSGLNYTEAVKLCNELEAVVSGVENSDELQQFTDEMTGGAWVSNYTKINDTYQWVADSYASELKSALFVNQNISDDLNCATISGSSMSQIGCSTNTKSLGAICGKPIW
ncbi:unnamed protein product [Caenorhabditis angaria]|uniref:PAN-3 domain-containing protein n=1 Tax=Caenorhabditis angaria TaxID=860376 RepID=A0A9P1MVI0_9PELO|nr:unnamed protein product [Caenorhabditis angaria]